MYLLITKTQAMMEDTYGDGHHYIDTINNILIFYSKEKALERQKKETWMNWELIEPEEK